MFLLCETYFEKLFPSRICLLPHIFLHIPIFQEKIGMLKGVVVNSDWFWLPEICYPCLESLLQFSIEMPPTLTFNSCTSFRLPMS